MTNPVNLDWSKSQPLRSNHSERIRVRLEELVTNKLTQSGFTPRVIAADEDLGNYVSWNVKDKPVAYVLFTQTSEYGDEQKIYRAVVMPISKTFYTNEVSGENHEAWLQAIADNVLDAFKSFVFVEA